MSDRTMLEEISIRGVGVIEEAKLELGPGFTVLTGETGAGKTMVLTALSLVLGGKADASLVRKGRERLSASATFQISTDVEEFASEVGAEVDEGSLILTRTLSADGKSKAIAGGVSVPAGTLSDLGERLIEVHGQSASMSITKVAKQREILDRFAGSTLAEAFDRYQRSFESYNQLKSKIAALRTNAVGREKEIAALREFAEVFSKVKPLAGEMEDLIQEISRLSSVESLRVGVEDSARLLFADESNVIDSLAQAKRNLESVAQKDSKITEILNAVAESYFLLSDAAQSAHTYLQDLEADPIRLEAAQARRAEINALLKRFATSGEPDDQIRELITRNDEVGEAIGDLSGGEERISSLEEELLNLFALLNKDAERLSKIRRSSAEEMSVAVTEEIHLLSMPHTQFFCTVISPEYKKLSAPDGFTMMGADEVAMTIQGHVGGPQVQVAKGASGGELSRIMLALEVVLAGSQPVGTYVFDEVDAGVGGKAAIEVGRRLYKLSRQAQVIVVTHLPQVAAWADSHFVLQKNSDGVVSQSDVIKVSGESRVEEIARMLAGHEDSQSARQHAGELLAMRY
ncbi:MAG: DNA repair protein RecN [Candidatus Nanopelagicaceae bacterium]|nr:DNA repair protein RecN [Candidatus Nanopelagicaceae bacterium]